MKRVPIFFSVLLFLMLSLSGTVVAQNLTGIWKGYFITQSGEYYKLEFQVKTNGSISVSGVSYSYLDVRFYGKATMTGNFSKSSNQFKIREIKTVEVKSLTGGGTCIMNYNLSYKRSGREEFLEGTYLGKTEVRNGPNPYAWGECGRGKVFLRRVTTSDFYIEPFLRGKIKRQEPIIVDKPPVKKDTSKAIVKNQPDKKDIIVNQPPVRKTDNPPIVKTDKEIIKTDPPPVKIKPVLPTPEVIKSRSNELVKSLIVTSPEVIVKLYDNGEIDDDTISVYYDNQLMLSSKKLTASPLTIKLDLDDDGTEHELVMVAENLGRIPPNTSLMIVESGSQRFEVRITSTEQKNAVVRFRYQKP